MNNRLVNSACAFSAHAVQSLPVIVLALGLSACGKQETKKASVSAAPAIQAASINASYEADCGAGAAAANAAAAFDVTSCHLNPQQLALLQEVGPLKVEADCMRQSVRIKNGAEQITGEGSINADGTFAVPLTIGTRFSEVEGCPVKLEGLASGNVTCDADKKVTNVNVNTAFNFSHVTDAAAALALVDMSDDPASSTPTPAPNPNPAPNPAPGPGTEERRGDDRDRDHDRDHRPSPGTGGQEKGGVIVKGGGTQQVPGKVQPTPPATGGGQQKGETPKPVVSPAKGGGQETGKTTPGGTQGNIPGGQQKGEQPKGGQQKGGQQKGGQVPGGTAPGQRVDACVSFSPCAFSSSAALSCSR